MGMGRMGQVLAHSLEFFSGHTATGAHQLHDVLVNNEYYPASGSFVDVSGKERVHILVLLGELADAITFEIYESDAVGGTEDQISATYCKHTCAADDDNEFVAFTIEVAKLSTDHHFLTCKVGSVNGSNYAAIFFLPEGLQLPTSSDALPAASQHEYVG